MSASPSAPKRPGHFDVGWMRVRVLWVPREDWPKEEAGRCGLFWPAQQEAWVMLIDGASERWYAETLLHECLHACWNLSGLTQHGGAKGGRGEEFHVSLLTGPLLDLLRRNPALAAYLLGAGA